MFYSYSSNKGASLIHAKISICCTISGILRAVAVSIGISYYLQARMQIFFKRGVTITVKIYFPTPFVYLLKKTIIMVQNLTTKNTVAIIEVNYD